MTSFGHLVAGPKMQAILWSADDSRKITWHIDHQRRKGAVLWGCGFRLDPSRFQVPLAGLIHLTKKATKTPGVAAVASVEEILAYETAREPPSIDLIPSHYSRYGPDRYTTWLKLTSVTRVSPVVHTQTLTKVDGSPIRVPPQAYVEVLLPEWAEDLIARPS
jgi:hypothetical protein